MSEEIDAMRLPQGDVRLLHTPPAQEMLQSKEPARIAYLGPDGLPRVVTMQFHWTGEELVVTSVATLPKVRALRDRPEVAITIDTFAIAEGTPMRVLSIRGEAVVTEVEGVVPEAYLANCRYIGQKAADGWAAWISQQGTPIARIAVRPTWVSLLDYQTRFPQGWPDHLRP
ncbi:MAG TPA: pyridoxamine 5'-phosphate oxidase family protein [Thermomicrobiales bacterium]|nr:pyridoxamine 5'-phosphate oxidase family protein [Thermomicrobiales bacterium]